MLKEPPSAQSVGENRRILSVHSLRDLRKERHCDSLSEKHSIAKTSRISYTTRTRNEEARRGTERSLYSKKKLVVQ
jgi:hypothetical protein